MWQSARKEMSPSNLWWTQRRDEGMNWKKQNMMLIPSVLFTCWFLPRCEYDSTFVQDDVILIVDFFFKQWRSYWTAACTTNTTSHYRPPGFAVDRVVYLNKREENKVNKEIMRPLGRFHWRGLKVDFFLENEFLEQLPWKFKCFFLCHLFNLKLFYMNFYGNIAIDKWRVFNIDSEGLCCQFQDRD